MTGQTDFTQPWMEAWAANMQPFMKSMFPAMPDSHHAADAKSQAEEQFAALNATWKDSIEKWAALAKEGARPDALTPEALMELFTPAKWSGPGIDPFDAGLREVLEGPKYATLWNTDREMLQLQQRAAERDKQAMAYQAIVQKAWNTAFERFSKSFASNKGEAPATWRGLTDRWLAVANEVLIEAHRSDEFVEAQSRMLRAASDYRLQERKMAEAWCAASHIPTRTEMDEMQRVVTELRRELRLLRRQAASPTEPTAASRIAKQGTVRSPAPKPRAAAKKTRRATQA